MASRRFRSLPGMEHAVSVGRNRFDETWHRLRDWTGGQAKSEMLAWRVIAADGYTRIDPAHTHGGPDGGGDAMCERDGEQWVMAAYFPLGQKTPATIKKKLLHDMTGAKARGAAGIAFVTNQEITLADREKWEQLDPDLKVDLFHLLRVTQILDDPKYSRTREEFLDIAAGPPPMLIKASVVGTAHAFTEDTEVLDRLVGIQETEIRKKSDEGHARVRAEREAKQRAEQEKRDREAAEKARTESKYGFFPDRVGIDIPQMSDILGRSGIFDSIANQYKAPAFLPGIPGMGKPPKPPEPLSGEQIEAKVARYRAGLESRWSSCRDYLAGIAWPALRFRIKNEAKSFLTDVEVILTFHGARGIDFKELEEFDLGKIDDPSWEPPIDPLAYSVVGPPVPRLAPPPGYPIQWRHNDDGDLEVTITLPRLRPHPEWRSDDYADDVVLVVDPGVDVDAITVTYTATAHGYGDVFEGEPITVPVESVAMLDVLREVIDATRKAS